MTKKLLQLIKKNQKILILRHKDPDLDAYGSQFGFFHALKAAFPEKTILAVGDTNTLNSFQPLTTNIVWPQASYTDAVHNAEFRNFYKVKVQLAP